MMIEVIIPVKDRPEIEQCVRSLLRSPLISHILVCDGGSQPACRQILATLNHLNRVQVLHLPQSGFNKSYLLNRGILSATAELILVSDADILWNETVLEQLQQYVWGHENSICSIRQVKETNPDTAALKRDRYTYRLIQNSDLAILEIQPVITSNDDRRPGCGLLCTRRTTFLKLGGYKELFQGWGWEDQDFLIRAQLLGISIETIGQVLHLSHTDEQRNRFYQHMSPSQTRNYNLLAAIGSLLKQDFWGDLSLRTNQKIEPKKMQIYLPEALRRWLHEYSCEGISNHDLSWSRNAFESAASLVATSKLLPPVE